MTKTLYADLKSASIDFKTLHKNYHPLLSLVKQLIGVVPNCDPVLEIWPTGFRTYNLLVPGLLNLPNTIFGGTKLKSAMGLAMYSSSKAAQCPYCTAHCCSFALRRGLIADAIDGNRTPREQAVVAFAEAISQVPAKLTLEECKVLADYFSNEEVVSILFAISLMGFLNKFMNGMGVELEQEAITDVGNLLSRNGWSPGLHFNGQLNNIKGIPPKKDNLLTYLRIVRQAPGAISLEKKWTNGVPNNNPAASEFLEKLAGYPFPILKHITRKRVVVTLTTVLRDNLDEDSSEIGLPAKCFSAYVFAQIISNDELKKEAKVIAKHFVPGITDNVFEKLDKIAGMPIPNDANQAHELIKHLLEIPDFSEREAAVIILTMAAAPSPTIVNDTVIEVVIHRLSPPGIIELMVWLSIQQLLHRLSTYYSMINGIAT
jgi:alkylhydroperoxidase family enzyme